MIKKSIFKIELINSQTNEIIESVITDSRIKAIEDMGISTEGGNIHFRTPKDDFSPFRIDINNDSSKYIMSDTLKTDTCESMVIARKYINLIHDIKKNKNCDWKSKLKAIRKYRGISKKRNIKAFKQAISKMAETDYDWKDDMIEFISKTEFNPMSCVKIYKACDVGNLRWAFLIS